MESWMRSPGHLCIRKLAYICRKLRVNSADECTATSYCSHVLFSKLSSCTVTLVIIRKTSVSGVNISWANLRQPKNHHQAEQIRLLKNYYLHTIRGVTYVHVPLSFFDVRELPLKMFWYPTSHLATKTLLNSPLRTLQSMSRLLLEWQALSPIA